MIAVTRPDAYVLCGGASRRLGVDKCWVELGGRPLIQRVLDALHPVSRRVVLLADRADRFSALPHPVLEDRAAGSGPLPAIRRALAGSETTVSLIASCDLPFVTAEYFRLTLSRLDDADACFAWSDDTVAPLAGAYRSSVGAEALEPAAATSGRMMDWVCTLNVSRLVEADFDELGSDLLLNVNTPADLERARARIGNREVGTGGDNCPP